MVSVMKEAPHPNAARLLAAWFASDDGLAARERLSHGFSIGSGAKSHVAEEIRRAGAKTILEDLSTMGQRAELYKKFSVLARGP
jgi:ABC-type Fe3+ transport system substrate-binding protein